jgi:hypothetical protein
MCDNVSLVLNISKSKNTYDKYLNSENMWQWVTECDNNSLVINMSES